MTPALAGDLQHFQPGEVMQLLQLASATGRLEVERPGEQVDVFFEGGRPVLARTTGVSVRTGELLVHRGAIYRETLERALEQQRRVPSERLGSMLIESRAATREQVSDAVQEVTLRILYGLALWSEGSFAFHPGERVRPDALQLDLELDRLLLEALRQADLSR